MVFPHFSDTCKSISSKQCSDECELIGKKGHLIPNSVGCLWVQAWACNCELPKLGEVKKNEVTQEEEGKRLWF